MSQALSTQGVPSGQTSVTTPMPSPVATSHWKVTVGMACLGVFVAYLPITAVSVILSTIQRSLGASTADLQWVSDAYTIPMAALILSFGVIGDVHGRKRVYLGGLALIVAGSAVSLVASSVQLLWIGQAIMGAGAAALLPSTLALISHAVPNPAKRGQSIALWASALTLGLVVGPFVAGGIIQYVDWRWVFLPMMLVALVALVAALNGAALLGESRAPAGRHLDWPGQITITIAIVALIYAVIEGGAAGWSSAASVGGFVVAALAFGSFVVAEMRGDTPMLRVDLFRSPAFGAASIVAIPSMFGLIGSNFVLSLFFGLVQHLSPLEIAYRFAVLNGVIVVVGPVVGRALATVPPRLPLIVGLLLAAAGMFTLGGLDPASGFDAVWPRLAVLGLGFGFVLTTVPAAAVNSVPHAQAGMAGAVNNTFRQLGGSLGPAVLGVVLTSRATAALAGHLATVGLPPTQQRAVLARVGRDGLAAAGRVPVGAGAGRALTAVGDSFVDGLHASVTLGSVALLAAAGLCALLLRPRVGVALAQTTPPAHTAAPTRGVPPDHTHTSATSAPLPIPVQADSAPRTTATDSALGLAGVVLALIAREAQRPDADPALLHGLSALGDGHTLPDRQGDTRGYVVARNVIEPLAVELLATYAASHGQMSAQGQMPAQGQVHPQGQMPSTASANGRTGAALAASDA